MRQRRLRLVQALVDALGAAGLVAEQGLQRQVSKLRRKLGRHLRSQLSAPFQILEVGSLLLDLQVLLLVLGRIQAPALLVRRTARHEAPSEDATRA